MEATLEEIGAFCQGGIVVNGRKVEPFDAQVKPAPTTEEDTEFFSDTPTESNPADSPPPGEPDEHRAPSADLLAGPGAYRLVRPSTFDSIPNHVTPTPAPLTEKGDKNACVRVVIGVARGKRRQ